MGHYRHIVTGNITGLVLPALLLLAPLSALAEPVEVMPLWGPYLTAASETGVTVNWKTAGETEGAVEYVSEDLYSVDGSYDASVSDGLKELHRVALTGLRPGTTYHYRVRIGEDHTAGHTFTTFGDGPFTFIVYGDTREQAPLFTQLERHKLVADRIADEKDLSFVLHTGDLVCDGDDMEEWGRFFNAARRMLDGLPIFPVAGNHENDSAEYYEIFGVPPYYAFGYGDAFFSMLDSNDGADLASEAAWLAGDVPPDAAWKFVVCHHPLYTSDENHWGGDLSLQEIWEPVFTEQGINAVFSAHMHAYERYYENGIHYAVLGNGGAPCYELAEEKIAGYRSSLEHNLGYARITIDGDRAVMEVVPVAELSGDNREVVRLYPPDAVFETVSLLPEKPAGTSIEISLDRDEVRYGDIAPGASSAEKRIVINNTGTKDVAVTLEVRGETTACDFYERSLYLDGAVYQPQQVVCSIPAGQSRAVATRLQVPSGWSEPGLMEATFIFWAEAP